MEQFRISKRIVHRCETHRSARCDSKQLSSADGASGVGCSPSNHPYADAAALAVPEKHPLSNATGRPGDTRRAVRIVAESLDSAAVRRRRERQPAIRNLRWRAGWRKTAASEMLQCLAFASPSPVRAKCSNETGLDRCWPICDMSDSPTVFHRRIIFPTSAPVALQGRQLFACS